MTQTEKDIFLKDLCMRLPYGVNMATPYGKGLLTSIRINDSVEKIGINNDVVFIRMFNADDVKPYLFPLSSMTEEQKYDFYCRFIENDCDFDDFKGLYLDNGMWHKLLTSLDDIEALIDWFHKNHIDYRGLIPMGVAIDATDKNIY